MHATLAIYSFSLPFSLTFRPKFNASVLRQQLPSTLLHAKSPTLNELLLFSLVAWWCWWLAALLCYGSSCFASGSACCKRRIINEKPFSFSPFRKIHPHAHSVCEKRRSVAWFGWSVQWVRLHLFVLTWSECVHKYQNMELNRVSVWSMPLTKYIGKGIIFSIDGVCDGDFSTEPKPHDIKCILFSFFSLSFFD